MAVQATRTVEEMEEYCARLRAAGLDAPWSRPGPLCPSEADATAIDASIRAAVSANRSSIAPPVSTCAPVEVTTLHGDSFEGNVRLARIESGRVGCLNVDDGSLASCANGKQKTIQYDGNKVYWAGGLAWRCVRGAGGRNVKLLAAGPTLPDVALAQIVSSGKRL